MNMTGIIYKATCAKTNKIYVGETITPLKWRKWEHEYCALVKNLKRKFYDSIRKHGKENFVWQTIETIEESNPQKMHDKLDEREKFWIDHYDSIKNGYNSMYGSPIKEGNNIGENNPAYIEININEEEYFMKANEGWNRKQLADHFGIPERHMKIWRKRMIAKDPMYKLRFENIDLKRKKKSAERNKAINKYAKHIEDIKIMLSNNISMRAMEKKLGIPFVAINRIIHRDLRVE